MNIVFFSDLNYEYQIRALIRSIDLHKIPDLKLIYYTVGFDSNLEREDLVKRRIELDPLKPRFEFYKPAIIYEVATQFSGHSIFLDSDIIVGRRFNVESLRNDFNFPMMSIGNWDTPLAYINRDTAQPFPVFQLDDRIALTGYRETGNICELDYDNQTYSIKNEKGTFLNVRQGDVEKLIIVDHTRIMDYFGIKKQTMMYVSSCFLSFNPSCADILLEWKSIAENEYLLSRRSFYFPFQDETPINVLLWKKEVSQNFGRIFVNTLNSETAIEVESRDTIFREKIFGNPNQFCDNSGKVQFYHGIKEPLELEKLLYHLESQSVL